MDLRAISIVFSIALALAGCETSGNPSAGAACEIFHPITYSRKNDTKPTKDQIREHNAAGKAACKWGN